MHDKNMAERSCDLRLVVLLFFIETNETRFMALPK